MKSIVDQAREAKNRAIELRDGKPREGMQPDYSGAATILVHMLQLIQDELNAFEAEFAATIAAAAPICRPAWSTR